MIHRVHVRTCCPRTLIPTPCSVLIDDYSIHAVLALGYISPCLHVELANFSHVRSPPCTRRAQAQAEAQFNP